MIIAGAIVGVLAVIIIISVTINKLNYYPQLKVYINITNKRNMHDADTCLNFYFNNYGTQEITEHLNAIQEWKKDKLTSCKGSKRKWCEYKIDGRKTAIKHSGLLHLERKLNIGKPIMLGLHIKMMLHTLISVYLMPKLHKELITQFHHLIFILPKVKAKMSNFLVKINKKSQAK